MRQICGIRRAHLLAHVHACFLCVQASVSCGENVTVVLSRDGQLYGWGSGETHQLGNNEQNDCMVHSNRGKRQAARTTHAGTWGLMGSNASCVRHVYLIPPRCACVLSVPFMSVPMSLCSTPSRFPSLTLSTRASRLNPRPPLPPASSRCLPAPSTVQPSQRMERCGYGDGHSERHHDPYRVSYNNRSKQHE